MAQKDTTMDRMGAIAADIVMCKAMEDKLGQASAPIEAVDAAEVEILRRQRAELVNKVQRATRTSLLTGGFEEKSEKEFFALIETRKERILAHFFQPQFEKCQLLNNGLAQVAHEHPETLFVRINAEEAPFLTQKLRVKVLPLLIFFHNGVSVARIEGFEGFGGERSFDHMALVRRLAQCEVIRLNEEERAALGLNAAEENSTSESDD